MTIAAPRSPRADVCVVGAGDPAAPGSAAGALAATLAVNLVAALAGRGRAAHLAVGRGASEALDLARQAFGAPLPWAPAPVTAAPLGAPAPEGALVVALAVAPVALPDHGALPEALAALLVAAPLVLVPLDAGAATRAALAVVERTLGAAAPARLRVVLARRMPRAADRWALVDRLEALPPGVVVPGTFPLGRRGAGSGAGLYAPGSAAAAAYARLADRVCAELAGAPLAGPAAAALAVSTAP